MARLKDPARRCVVWDIGRRCQREGIKHYNKAVPADAGYNTPKGLMCRKHYQRALRHDGDVRGPKEIRMIRARAAREKRLRALEETFGRETTDAETAADAGDGDPEV